VSGAKLIHARFIVPVRPADRVLENHAVVIEQGVITALLSQSIAREKFPDAEHIELPHHVLLPGLINTHTHSPMTLLRGYADDLDLHVWLEQHIWPAEQQFVSPDFVRDGTRLAVTEMLRSGTTCFNDMYFFPDAMVDVVLESGIRACIGLPLIEIATPWARDINDYFDKGLMLWEQWKDQPLISFSFAPHAPYTVSDDTLVKIRQLSLRLGLRVHLHLLETEWDIKHSLQQHDLHPLQRLEKLELLNDRLLAVHMTQLSKDDIELLTLAGVHVIHCPQSNLKLASGICPVTELLEAGVNVAMGTDGAASNNDLDLMLETQTAALLAKGVSGKPSAVRSFEALEMMTINGARALGLEDRIGSIEAGKEADLCAVDIRAPELQPLHNVISQLIYAASGRNVSDVWVAGRRLLSAGELTSLDLGAIGMRAEQWHAKMTEFHHREHQEYRQ
jgi:5-methylthioadenosine/S-adenosylhomocysteine deaminase